FLDQTFDHIGHYFTADAFHLNRRDRPRAHHVADERIGFVAQHDAAGLGDGLQPRRQIRFRADDRVIHAVFAAEIADIAEAGVDAHAGAEWLLDPALAPFGVKLREPPLHVHRHQEAGAGVFGHAFGL